jgi:hypothetical protein
MGKECLPMTYFCYRAVKREKERCLLSPHSYQFFLPRPTYPPTLKMVSVHITGLHEDTSHRIFIYVFY